MSKVLTNTKTTEAAALCLHAASAHNYICDMIKELTQIAQEAELKELTALLRVTSTAADTHERFL